MYGSGMYGGMGGGMHGGGMYGGGAMGPGMGMGMGMGPNGPVGPNGEPVPGPPSAWRRMMESVSACSLFRVPPFPSCVGKGKHRLRWPEPAGV